MSTIQKPSRRVCWCWRTISRRRRRTRLRTTAPPMRREVTKPTRHGPEFSTGTTLAIRSLPRRVNPSRFTRSYSDACVRCRALGKENESARLMLMSIPYHKPKTCWRADVRDANLGLAELALQLGTRHPYSRSLLPKVPGRRLPKKKTPQNLGTGRRFSRRFGCCRRRFRCSSRTGCATRRGRTRGGWTCRRLGCLSLLFARRE